MNQDIPIIGLSTPEMEDVTELGFFYADHRANAAQAFAVSGYSVNHTVGDTYRREDDGTYVVVWKATKPGAEDAVVTIPKSYLWVTERRQQREKKSIIVPPLPPAQRN